MYAYKILGENKEVFGEEKFGRKWRVRGTEDPENLVKDLRVKDCFRFRVCDDDGITYFWGVSTTKDSFAPLSLGRSYGCTYIEYKNAKGEYKVL